jgi:DNA-binding FadR family transcriptional regulator
MAENMGRTAVISGPIAPIGLHRGNAASALRRMRSLIERGRFHGRLPPERELAAELQVGRSTLRKALEVLEAEGHIWRHVGQGTFVGRRPAPGHEPLMPLRKVSPKELLEARLTLEPAIAACAATGARPDNIARIRLCALKRETTKDPDAYNLWDHQFHLAIAEATQNPIMLALLNQLNALRHTPTWSSYKKGRMQDPYYTMSKDQHRAISDAIDAHDAAAAFRAMKVHIIGVQDGFSGWSSSEAATAADEQSSGVY